MTEYIEPNYLDPEECDACFAIEDICDYHRGVADGAEAVASAFAVAAEDPEWLLDTVAAMKRDATRVPT